MIDTAEITPDGLYAITISPPYRLSLNGIYKTNRFLFFRDKQEIQTGLNRCSKHYFIYPEITLDGRLHYHGLIRIDDLIKWKRSTITHLRRQLGLVCIKPPNKVNEGWLKYCNKEWEQTRQVLGIEEIIYYQNLRNQPKPPTVETEKAATKTLFDYYGEYQP